MKFPKLSMYKWHRFSGLTLSGQHILSQGIYARAYAVDPSQNNLDSLNSHTTSLVQLIEEVQGKNISSDAAPIINNLKDQSEIIAEQMDRVISSVQTRDISAALSVVNGDYTYTSNFTSELAGKVEQIENTELDKVVNNTKNMISLSMILSVIFIIIALLVIASYMIYTKYGITLRLQSITKDLEHMVMGILKFHTNQFAQKMNLVCCRMLLFHCSVISRNC